MPLPHLWHAAGHRNALPELLIYNHDIGRWPIQKLFIIFSIVPTIFIHFNQPQDQFLLWVFIRKFQPLCSLPSSNFRANSPGSLPLFLTPYPSVVYHDSDVPHISRSSAYILLFKWIFITEDGLISKPLYSTSSGSHQISFPCPCPFNIRGDARIDTLQSAIMRPVVPPAVTAEAASEDMCLLR